MKNMTNKQRLLTYLNKHKKSMVAIVLLSLVFVASQLSQPFILGKALDCEDKPTYYALLIVSLAIVIVGTICDYIFELTVSNLSQKVIYDLRNDVYQKLNSIPVNTFDTKNHGDLIQLEIRDMENVTSGLYAVFKTFIQGIFTVIITIMMMFMVNWILAIGVIILSPLSVIMASFVARFNTKHFKKQAFLQSEINSLSTESINNIFLLQSMNGEEAIYDKFSEINENLRKEGRIAQFSASWVNPSTRLVNNTIYVIIGIAGIIMMFFDKELALVFAVMSIGRLSSFLSYTTQYSKPFNEISSVTSEYETAKSSFARINSFLNIENDIDDGQLEVNSFESIQFKNISFSYTKGTRLIENFSFEINKGQKIAIVGPTGAGKTTLINLLMRFYEVDNGEILFNNISYKDIKTSSLRKNMGMVLQDSWIFHGSVLDNVRYTKPNASDDEVIEACKKAHADVFINTLPNGYQTLIKQSELSQGEKQMICIARVMLLNPELVILDEATSNIDTRSEMLITKAFDDIMKNKTSVVIAHRLSTIVSADKIIVINNGSIVETGNHQELMKQKGFYYSLYSSQFK